MNKTLLVLLWCFGAAALFGSDDRPRVYFAITRIADEDTKVDSWLAMGRRLPLPEEGDHCWYWYPRYGKPFFAVVTPVMASDCAIFGVRFCWDIKDANAGPRNLQYIEAKWDTPTPFTFDGRKFVLFASLKSLEYVKERTYPARITSSR